MGSILVNPRITKRERGLIKGALRRVFSRSELRREVIKSSIIKGHVDNSRPRVKTWCRCAICGKPEAISKMVVDHIEPVVKLTLTLEDMTWDDLVDRLWCAVDNLQAVCESSHREKTKAENKQRRLFKKTTLQGGRK